MSDVTVAPAGGAPAAASNEVVVDTNQTQAPQPVGSQAPEKQPVEVKDRPPTRKEAIQRAFERANNPQPKTERRAAPEAKPAEAKPGHNNPPEETEKLDLKKRPEPARAEQPREQGRFVRREEPGQQQPAQQQQPGQRTDPYSEPPPRLKDHAKAEWSKTPESVRGEVHRMHQEFAGAYKQYRGDYEAMEPIRRFHKMATDHGTTLEKALTNYTGMEAKLRADVVGGLDVIVNNLNLRTPDGQRLGLRDIAYHVLSQSPDQLKTMQNSNAQVAAQHQIGALHQEIAGLKQTLQQMHTAQQFTYTRSAVDQFADKHPRFDELGDLIEGELKLGFDLDTAYRRAELLRPTTQAAQTRTHSAQTRPTDKSISGAPDAGPSNGTSRRTDKPVGRREAIRGAIRRVNGGL